MNLVSVCLHQFYELCTQDSSFLWFLAGSNRTCRKLKDALTQLSRSYCRQQVWLYRTPAADRTSLSTQTVLDPSHHPASSPISSAPLLHSPWQSGSVPCPSLHEAKHKQSVLKYKTRGKLQPKKRLKYIFLFKHQSTAFLISFCFVLFLCSEDKQYGLQAFIISYNGLVWSFLKWCFVSYQMWYQSKHRLCRIFVVNCTKSNKNILYYPIICWKHSPEILVWLDMLASHSCRFARFLSISCSITTQCSNWDLVVV